MLSGEIDNETFAASEEQDAGTYPGVAEQLFPEEEPVGIVTAQGAEELPLPELPPEEQPVAARAPSDQQDALHETMGTRKGEGGGYKAPPSRQSALSEAEVLTPQQLVQMLDSGFDKLVEQRARAPAGAMAKMGNVMSLRGGQTQLPYAPPLNIKSAAMAAYAAEPGETTAPSPEGGTPYVGAPGPSPEGGTPYVGAPGRGAAPAPAAPAPAAPAPAAPAPAAAARPATPNYENAALIDRVNPFTGKVRALPQGMRADGSMGVIPTAEEIRRPQGQPQARQQTALQEAMREANSLFPWASQDRMRAAYVAQRMGEQFKRGTEWGKEDIRGRRTHETELARTERAERGQTSREQIAADRNEAAARRQQADIEARSTRQQADFDARSQRLREQQDAITKREMLKAELSTLARQNATFGRLMGEHLRADPSLAANPFELLKRLGPSMQKMNIDTDAIRSRVLMTPSLPGAPATGERGVGAATRDSTDAAAERNLTPGQVVPREFNGKTYNYIVGPDGRLYEENEYKRRGMGR